MKLTDKQKYQKRKHQYKLSLMYLSPEQAKIAKRAFKKHATKKAAVIAGLEMVADSEIECKHENKKLLSSRKRPYELEINEVFRCLDCDEAIRVTKNLYGEVKK